MKAIEPKKALSTLINLYSGNRCPHEQSCACRASDWCPKANGSETKAERDYPMLHLAGCSFGYDRCCCRVLDEIEALAHEFLDSAGISDPPVPIEMISLCDSRRPIEMRLLPLKAYFGCAWFLGNEWIVHLNSNNPPEVNRFTAFHEGFHIVCSNSGISFSKVDNRCRPLGERLADYFAASMLMPRQFVQELWPQVQDIEEMATRFGAPRIMMSDWLQRLGFLPVLTEDDQSVKTSSGLALYPQ
ncbi:MAG: ImmA/IrrE family metallo-endopeptidase [Dehalococcoidia bacterium]